MANERAATDLPQEVLDECAREPIHIPGSIQPCGTLLALDDAWQVRQCAANVEYFLGRPWAAVLNQPLAAVLGEEAAACIRAAFAGLTPGVREDLGSLATEGRFAADIHFHIHQHDSVRIVEIAPGADVLRPQRQAGVSHPASFLNSLQRAAIDVKSDSPMDEFSAMIARQVHFLTGYGRVLVYRFDAAANGEVIAEARRDGLEPYLGLWYPAADIPPQARELFLRNPFRALVDVDAVPVPLLPRVNPATGRELDLSYALLRSPSPVHCEYLSNMGVRASLAASITLAGRLWGLLVCHDAEPRIPQGPVVGLLCGMAELVAAHVALVESREWSAGVAAGHQALQQVPTQLDQQGDWGTALAGADAALMEAMRANGIAVVHDGRLSSRGLVPPSDAVWRLVAWLNQRQEGFFVTDQLGHVEPAFSALAPSVCGMVALRVPHMESDWVLWFRPEAATTVQWAGDPRKGLVEDATRGRRLTPRKSFEAWVQEVRGRSLQWSIAERATASDAVRGSLVNLLAAWQQRQVSGLRTYQGILFDQVNDAVVVTDLAGKVTFWNDAATRLYGRTRAEMLGQSISPTTVPEHYAEIERVLGQVRDRGDFLEELLLPRQDGSQSWVHLRGQSLREPNGAAVGWVGVGRDISAIKTAEAQLRLMQAVVTSSRDAILVVTADADEEAEPRIEYANPAVLEMTGYRLEEVLGKPLAFFHGAHTDQVAADQVSAALRRREGLRVELIYYRRDGSEFWAELVLTPVAEQAGAGNRIVATQRDVTERVHRQLELHASEARLAEAQRVARLGSWTFELPANKFWWSDAIFDLYGLDRSTVQPSFATFLALVHPDDRAGVTDRMQAIHGGAVGFNHDLRIVRPDGRTMLVHIEGRVTRDAAGNLVRIEGVDQDITERRRNEQALRDSEEQLRLLIAHAPAALAMFDREMRYITASRRWASDYGLDGQELRGRSHYEVFPEISPAWREVHRRVLGGEVVTADDEAFPRADGSVQWLRWEARPWHDADGQIGGIAIFSEDITNRRRAEMALRESEERYRTLVDHATDAILLQGDDGVILDANHVACEALGYCRDELIGMRPIGFDAEITPGRMAAIGTTLAAGKLVAFDSIHRRKDGSTFPVEVRIRPFAVEGRHYGLAIVRDITDRKRAEEEIRQLNADLETRVEQRTAELRQTVAIIEASTDLIAIATPDGRPTYLNAAFRNLCGLQPNFDLHQTQIVDYHPSGVGERVVQEALPAAARAGHWLGETAVLCADGRTLPVSQLVLAHRGADGAVEYYSTIMRDISERKRTEETLRERSEELAQANAALARAGRLKDEFLASMSHELRTPLNGVLALSEALQESVYGPLNAAQTTALRDIEESGRHLLALINDILDLSKVEAGEVRLELAPTPVQRVCQASLGMVKELAQKKQLRMTLSVDDAVSSILADERRLKQILVNLLSNAVKFTPAGGAIGLAVTADPERQRITFAVWDTGIGIRQENMGLLFRAFQQIDSSLSREYSGTGLGLALVDRLTKLHGGSVTVESTPGKGSRFLVTLPWQETHAAPVLTAGDETIVRKVLMVEDSMADAFHLSRYLAEMGIEVTVHSSADGAVDRARLERPHLILLDIKLPDSDGWQVLAALKASADVAAIPVIVVSVVDDRRRALDQGATDYLVKPVSRDDLQTTLERLVVPRTGALAIELAHPAASPPPLVLVAEDNAVNARTVSDYLRAAGYRVARAVDGAAAVEQTRTLRPEIVLMDIQMPVLDGLEAIRQLRADPATAAIPIIAVTALAMAGDRERCLAVGADAYLTKPVSLKELRAAMERFLRHAEQPGGHAPPR